MLNAKRKLLLFLVVYMFTQQAPTGRAPIEGIVPEARRTPLYRLSNDPFRAPLWDPAWAPEDQPCVRARRPFGCITIANADAAAYAYTDAAIDEGYRAVQELFTAWGTSRHTA